MLKRKSDYFLNRYEKGQHNPEVLVMIISVI
jgi:hypothetical protein